MKYVVTQTLQESRRLALYRGIRESDHLPVTLKVLGPHHRSQDLDRLKNELSIGRELMSPGVVHPLSLETFRGRPALIMEGFDGESLDRQLGNPMPVDRFLPLAIRIAASLGELHRQNVVHKDVKPENILVHRETGEVRFTDLELAAQLPCPQPIVGSARLIEGSLPYMAPEQTGRVNRAVDQRSDLYSLGITFYELLTGQLPFQASDPLGWVHCQIARKPAPPTELIRSIPAPLSALVLKLLSKEPNDRYQSAASLQHDLQRLLEQWQTTGRIDQLPVEMRVAEKTFRLPQKLYGREREISELRRAFQRTVESGVPELVLVSGYSGIGKSSLVRELHQPVLQENGFFVAGKFDQYKRDVPYFIIVQAFGELVLDLLAGTEAQVAEWRQRFLDELGGNGQVIIDVIPAVELIIGPQPPVPDLPPTESQNRFQLVFRRFVSVLARREHPLVLFLDDLQWADAASLALVQDLVSQEAVQHLLIVGAYRENEVGEAHPLMLTRESARKAGARISEIHVAPLAAEHLNTLVADALQSPLHETAPLAALVRRKTGGNPFFVLQFLASLYEEHLLSFDAATGKWRWDADQIDAKGYADSVVELMVGKLHRLPDGGLAALKTLACLGTGADVEFLALAHGSGDGDVRSDLRSALRAHLILQLGDAVRFAHDRVQEAAYSLIPEDERPAKHLQIGRRLLAGLSRSARDERLFDVVSQLNRGSALISDEEEREELCWLNFAAGKRAKTSAAYAAAQKYFEFARALLPRHAWELQHEYALSLWLESAECEPLVGSFSRAEAMISEAIARARTDLERARASRLRLRMYLVSGRYAEAVSIAIEALKPLGVSLPSSAAEIEHAIAGELTDFQTNLRGRRIEELIDAPPVEEPIVRATISLLVDAIPGAYIGRPPLFPLLALKAVNASLVHGNIEESCFAYSIYGVLLVSGLGEIASGFELSEMSLRLNERFNDARWRGTLLHLHGDHINFWRRPIATGLPILDRAFRACLEVGDLLYASALSFETVWQLLEKGDSLEEVLRASYRFAAFAHQIRNDAVYETIRLEQQFVKCLQGKTLSASSFSDAEVDEEACLATIIQATFGCGIAFFHIMKQASCFMAGQLEGALAASGKAEEILGAVKAMPIEATHHFLRALTLTTLASDASSEQQQSFRNSLESDLTKLRIWSENCPENYECRFALVSAEVAGLDGRDAEAMRLYERAIQSAGDNGFVPIEAMANELAARFYRARGLDRIADTYLREARAGYLRWGAAGKVRLLDQQHPQLVAAPAVSSSSTIVAEAQQLDLLAVIKASQAISSEIVLDRLLSQLVRTVVELAGAQRGTVLLHRDGRFVMGVDAATDEKGDLAIRVLSTEGETQALVLPSSILSFVLRTKERVLLDDATQSTKFARDAYVSRVRPKSILCEPILKQAELLGVLYLENNLVAGSFTADRVTMLELIASRAAVSLENALLLAKERAARKAAEDAQRRAAFLAEGSALLNESLHEDEILRRLARLCVPSFADWCVIDLVEDGQLRRVTGIHRDPEKQTMLDQLRERYPPRPESTSPAPQVLRTGKPLFVPESNERMVRASCIDEEHFRLISSLGVQSALCVPFATRGLVMGTISYGTGEHRSRFTQEDFELAMELARRAAIAIDNARLLRRTEEAVRLRDEFLSVASHELRTPIYALQLAAQGLTRGAVQATPENTLRMAGVVERQVARLTRLVEELLDVSKIEAGRIEVKREAVDLVSCVQEAVKRLSQEITQARCAVTIEAENPVVGQWDRLWLEEIVINLLTNAVKFGPGKPVEISVAEVGGEKVRLTVTDHGIGIQPERLPSIFQRFERAVSAREYGGLGLGLFIVKSVVEALGGTVGAESTVGQGSTFTVELPLREPASQADVSLKK